MVPKYLGEVVLQRREQLGLSQQMVCEGLCTVMTLSRFEKGLQTPSRDCVVAILQRLGLPDNRYYAQLTKKETQLIILRKEVRACCSRFEQSTGEERQQARVKALEKLGELEHCIKKDDRINRQFILGIQATLGADPSKTRLDLQMEAIYLTSPRFDLNNLSNCLYSTSEMGIINKIAVSYSHNGQHRKSIDIYDQLLKIIQKRMPNHSCLPLMAHNYAQILRLENRLEESLDISELGLQVCIQKGHYYLVPRFLHIKAECYYSMGAIDRSKGLYQSAYYIYEATMDTKNQEILKIEARERLNLVL